MDLSLLDRELLALSSRLHKGSVAWLRCYDALVVALLSHPQTLGVAYLSSTAKGQTLCCIVLAFPARFVLR